MPSERFIYRQKLPLLITMIKGKGGFLRILEAFISVMIIAGVLVFIYVNNVQKPSEQEAISQLERIILEEITSNSTLRNAVLNEDLTTISNAINKFVPEEYKLEFKICEINEICKLDETIEKEIISKEITVSSTLTEYNPKVIRLFMWEKD